MNRVSVLISVDREAGLAKTYLDGLDAQSLPPDRFDVVWCLEGAPAETADHLTAVAPHRPNVSTVSTGPFEALARCRGEYVVLLSTREHLFPDGLERLLETAEMQDLDTAVGRTANPGQPLPERLLVEDAEGLTTDDLAALPDGAYVAAVRREVAEIHRSGRLLPAGRCGLAAGGPVAALARADTAPQSPIDCEHAGWDGGELVVECRLPEELAPACAVLEHRTSGRQLTLPVSVSDDGGRIQLRLDPRDTAGAPLEPGLWQLLLQLSAADGSAALRPMTRRPFPPALLGNQVVVPQQVDGWLGLDVGPTTRPLVLPGGPELARVRETVAGSRLTLDLPDVHVDGTDGLDGGVGFGDIRVPARLVVADRGLRLEAMATGVQGTVPLTTRFGATWFRPSGLSLQISNDGGMTVVRTPPPAQKLTPAEKPPAGTRPPVEKKPATSKPTSTTTRRRTAPRQGTLAALRRRTPRLLEPLVSRAARQPTLRRAYRRLTR